MTDPTLHPLEMILRQCAVMAPAPWYPSVYARTTGVPRDSLDPHLDQLRLGGLIRLTDWVQGVGQGYALTPEGQFLLESPRALARLREGKLVVRAAGEVEAAPATNPVTNAWERGEAVRGALLYRVEGEAARALIFLNVMVFMVGLVLALSRNVALNTFLGGGLDLFNGGQERVRADPVRAAEQGRLREVHASTGALSGEHLVRGQWWRLLTSAFVHFGLLHLGLNMYAVYVLGRLTEPMWGRLRFLLLFLLAALGGACAHLVFQPYGLFAGASGGVCGVLASAVVWIVLNRHYLPQPLVAAFLRNLLINIVLIAFLSTLPGVSWAGHLGGGVAGALAAVLLNYQRFGSPGQRGFAVAGLVALASGLVGLVLWAMQYDPRWERLREVDRAGMVVVKPEDLQRPEAQPLRERLLPLARKAEEEAETVYRDVVWPLLRQEPGERDPEKVRAALTSVQSQRRRLLDAAEFLEKETASFADVVLATACHHRAAHLRQRVRVFEMLADRLDKGTEWTPANAAALALQRWRVGEDDLKWQRLLPREPPEQAPQ